MKGGGGKGGGAGSARAFGIGMDHLDENDEGGLRIGVREYRWSKAELGSYTRIEGGEVRCGMSMSDGMRRWRCHESVHRALVRLGTDNSICRHEY
jgi:hypothetical protein